MMRWFVVVGVLISNYILPSVLAMSDEMKELAEMLHNSCVDETGVSEALIDKVNTEKVFADDENLKCYIKCLMAQMACIDDDGIIDEEATIAILPEEMQETAAPVIRACGTKKGANPCENAWLSHKCYAEMEPNIALILGYSGACRREELVNITIHDLQFKDDSVLVAIPKTKNGLPRLFIVTQPLWVLLIKQYTGPTYWYKTFREALRTISIYYRGMLFKIAR